MDLHGKIVLVTGAGKRLGRASALALAQGGADVILHVYSSAGEDVAQEVTALGRRAYVLRADLASVAGAAQLSQDAIAVAGRVDVLVNNAAVFLPTPVDTLTLPTWQTIVRTNLTSSFVLALSLGREMRARGYGKIVQIGDWSGSRPMPGYLAYCVSKGGLHALTMALAKAFAPQVQVNTVAPGPVLLPVHYDAAARQAVVTRTPLRRLGQAADVARAVRFVVEGGEFVTGAIYMVDGGWLVSAAGGTDTSL